MDFTATQDAIVAWVRALLALDPIADVVQWENEPRRQFNARLVLLSWIAFADVGVDEVRWEASDALAPLPNLTPVVVGCRTATLQISVETLSQAPSTPNARALVERLRDRLRTPSSLAALAAANLGLIGTDNVVQSDYRTRDGRWNSRALLSVRLNATSFVRDTEGATGSIETVEVTSHVTNPAGSEIAPALQMNAEVLP